MQRMATPSPVSSRSFTWGIGLSGSTASADASDLQGFTGAFTLDSRQAQSLFVESHKTGYTAKFMLKAVVRDLENDVLFWEFRGTANGTHVTVFIYND